MFALNLVTFIPIFYATTYLGAKQEEFGAKLIFGGVFQGLALTLLIWLYMYTASHPEDEAAFASVFGKMSEVSSDNAGSGVAAQTATATVGADSEF